MSDRSPKSKRRERTQKKIAKGKAAKDARSKQDEQGVSKNTETKATNQRLKEDS